jgi:hypothetical protein
VQIALLRFELIDRVLRGSGVDQPIKAAGGKTLAQLCIRELQPRVMLSGELGAAEVSGDLDVQNDELGALSVGDSSG